MTFGENLQRLRKARGLSQQDLAGVLNVTRQCIQRWEVNKTQPPLGSLRKICQLLQITLDQLLPEDIDNENMPKQEED